MSLHSKVMKLITEATNRGYRIFLFRVKDTVCKMTVSISRIFLLKKFGKLFNVARYICELRYKIKSKKHNFICPNVFDQQQLNLTYPKFAWG